MLQALRTDMFPVEGRQEDAEEFLSFILNRMNDEMIEVRMTHSLACYNFNNFLLSASAEKIGGKAQSCTETRSKQRRGEWQYRLVIG